MTVKVDHIDNSYYINDKFVNKERAIKKVIQHLKNAAEIYHVSNAQYAIARLYYNNTLVCDTIKYIKNIPELQCKCLKYYFQKMKNINLDNIDFIYSRYDYFGDETCDNVYKKACYCINDSFILNNNKDNKLNNTTDNITNTLNNLNLNDNIRTTENESTNNNNTLNQNDNIGNYTINSHDYWKQCENICNLCAIVKAFNELASYKWCLKSAQQNNPLAQ
eukprot:jgi/Orpsp1_1/1176275/evm.model.c7180000057015.1